MIITGADRQRVGNPVGTYYIGMYGIMPCTFILVATLNEHSIIPLISGIPMQGFVNHGDTDHYTLDLPFNRDLNITVELLSLAGDADLYGKQCFGASFARDCLMTQEELERPWDSIWSSRNSTMLDAVVVQHKARYCRGYATCRYVFAAYGKS